MTSAFEVRTAEQAAPKFDFALWGGSNQAEVTALLKRCEWWRAENGPITVTLGSAGELTFSAPYYKFVLPAGMYLVAGPYWGGELWGPPDGGQCPYEWINPALFATRFPNA